MKLWVVAAAVGAGCLATYWSRHSKGSDRSCQLSSEDTNFENHKLGKDVSSEQKGLDGKSADGNLVDGLLTVETTPNKMPHSEKIRNGNCDASTVLSISRLPLSPLVNLNDVEDVNEQISSVGCNYGFLFPDSSAREVGPNHHSAGNITSLLTKHLYGHLSRPLNSLEGYLMAHLYKENSKMEEYVLSSLPSPSTHSRSFLVSNGSQIISKLHHKSFSTSIGKEEHKWHEEAYQENDESKIGIPALPKIGSFDDHKKLKHKVEKWRSERLSSSNSVFSGKHIHAQLDATCLFSLGISFGIIISIIANKREVEKLRDSLKHTENLVQDLQEELEMKDSMTMKELGNENYGSQDTCDHSYCDKELNGFSLEKRVDNSPRDYSKELYDQKEEENSELMSKIEAELEKLGLNMNTSSLDRRLSELVEVDPDFVADFAQGELRVDMVRVKAFSQPKSDEDTSDTATPLPGNYAVSPHELSLRLHEVIESRLEERVKELEIALQNSQRKVQLLESEHKHCYRRDFHNYGQASPFRGNQLTYDDFDPMEQPLVMNLSGEALDAYNEAYEEAIKTDESQDTCDHSYCDEELNGFSLEKHMVNSPTDDSKELYYQKEEENSELISEIEAELEKLGLNINTFNLDRRLSELVEVDPDFVADFAQGVLRVDMVKGKAFSQLKSDEDTSDTATPLPRNYAVSRHELSLRLYEVIEFRIEERVKVLEIGHQNSQRKVQLLESVHKHYYRRDFHNYGQASHFRGNPLTYDDFDPMEQPLVMNLSGEALDAYNKAYEELIKADESEREFTVSAMVLPALGVSASTLVLVTCVSLSLWFAKKVRDC